MRGATRWLITWLCCWSSTAALAQPSETQKQLQAVFLGRFASYVQWAQQPAHPAFTITVVGDNPFGTRLAALYADKQIQGRPVRIHTVAEVADIGTPDVLFVALPTVAARQAAIAHAQAHGILTISDAKGFAEQGGIIQVNFVGQNAQLKINHDAAVQSGLRIAAPLLSIATVLRENQP